MALTKKNVRCTSTMKETERKTDNQVGIQIWKVWGLKEENPLDRTKWNNDFQY